MLQGTQNKRFPSYKEEVVLETKLHGDNVGSETVKYYCSLHFWVYLMCVVENINCYTLCSILKLIGVFYKLSYIKYLDGRFIDITTNFHFFLS